MISAFLLSLGFTASTVDPCVFFMRVGVHLTLVLLYVDDVFLAGTLESERVRVRTAICERFRMKVLGPLTRFIGFDFQIGPDFISVSQRHYASQLIRDMDPDGSLPTSPIPGCHDARLADQGDVRG